MQFDAGALVQQAVENCRLVIANARNETETGDNDSSHDLKMLPVNVDPGGFKAHTIAQSACFASGEF